MPPVDPNCTGPSVGFVPSTPPLALLLRGSMPGAFANYEFLDYLDLLYLGNLNSNLNRSKKRHGLHTKPR